MGIKGFRAQVTIQNTLSKKSTAPEFYRKISQNAPQSQKNTNNIKKTVTIDIKQSKSSS